MNHFQSNNNVIILQDVILILALSFSLNSLLDPSVFDWLREEGKCEIAVGVFA